MRRLFAGFLAALALTSALAATVEYVDLSEARPDDDSVRILSTGDKYSSFERDGPFVLDPQFLQEYGSLGYLHVHYQPNGDNDYKGQSSQYVASIKDASVCGSEGDVWDSQGRLYRMNTWVRHPVSKLEAWKAEAESHGVKHFKRLASAVHRVSFMYFHFMAEALPRITKFAPYLKADPELMLLTYGSSFEQAWIQKLGIRSEQVVTFDPLFAYHADELLVSNPVEIARTPREDLQEMLSRLGLPAPLPADQRTDLVYMLSQLGLPAPLPADQRTDLVYVSRRLAADRIQTNEDALLTALEAEAKAQGLRLVVHDGNPSLTADDTIEMFRRARAVMGPNGAGLAHMLFAPPGTILVELMFINNTGMDLWHMTNALGQRYYMVPLPRSHWLDPGSDVPVEQAVATLRWALATERKQEPDCPSGSAPGPNGACASCPAGTFSTGFDSSCLPCTPGWVSERMGAGFCHICLPSSFAASATACSPCPAGKMTAMPGSTKPEECLDPQALDEVKQTWLPTNQVVAKVSAYYQAIARRRSTKEVDFAALPDALKDRILSELDSCSSYSKYSTYGCSKPPSASPSPSPPPVRPEPRFTSVWLRAVANGPLSGCTIQVVTPEATLVNLTERTNATGWARVNLSSPIDLALIKLTGCTEASLNRTGFSTLGVAVVTGGIDDVDKAADYFNFYRTVATRLGVPVALYGSPTAVHGILDVWTAGLAGTNMTGSSAKVGTARASEALLFSIYKVLTNQTTSLNISSPAVQRSIAKYALASVDVDEPLFRRSLAERRVLQNGVSADDLTAAIADSVSTSVSIQVAAVDRLAAAIAAGSALSIADISNILTQAAQAAMAQRTVAGAASSMAAGTLSRSIAKYALASVDVDEPLFRRSLAERRVLQNGVSADDLTAAIADSVSTSVSIQVAAVDRLAAAIAAGSALSIADISNILTQAAQAAMAQRTVAGAASSMAAGTLSVTSFRASYTGDALLAYINSIIVTLPELTASDYHKKKTNVGAIVGGTIGGFFGLVLIIVLVVVLVRRNKAHVQPRQQGDVENK
ncbi:hypothetical protein GPECTOR_8g390 [Gonium pectorale]|uniref:Glycosyltransferase 61 catalytic domain-containing protein n=1 Tax=Gonium pectorale TaxID=33097 RepID=A0A150GT81_GONPE|nr:hypothetical protein GPECTOR_8g390 [Gonium pectorale]|eukprot:KXZ53023.1 hypothetical protein GPECTOR_8g390 [Gonium pectorale]